MKEQPILCVSKCVPVCLAQIFVELKRLPLCPPSGEDCKVLAISMLIRPYTLTLLGTRLSEKLISELPSLNLKKVRISLDE